MSSDDEEPHGPLAPLPPRRAAPPPSAFPDRQPSFGTDRTLPLTLALALPPTLTLPLPLPLPLTLTLTLSRQPSFGTDAASALVALSAIGAAAATEQQWLAAPPTADAATRSEGGEEADTRSEGGEEAEGRRPDLVSYQPPDPRPSPDTQALTRILSPKP